MAMKHVSRKFILSRVRTNGDVRVCGCLRLSGLSYYITVVGGTGDGGVNGGSVVGVRYPVSFVSLSVLKFVSRGVAMGVVRGKRVVSGGPLALPGGVGGIVHYGGPEYVASIRRKLSRMFMLASRRGRMCEYRCYRRGCDHEWSVIFLSVLSIKLAPASSVETEAIAIYNVYPNSCGFGALLRFYGSTSLCLPVPSVSLW